MCEILPPLSQTQPGCNNTQSPSLSVTGSIVLTQVNGPMALLSIYPEVLIGVGTVLTLSVSTGGIVC